MVGSLGEKDIRPVNANIVAIRFTDRKLTDTTINNDETTTLFNVFSGSNLPI